MDKENLVLDIIIEFVKAAKDNDKLGINYNGENYVINNAEYLLNQILRQYYLKDEHYCVSKEAKKLWDSITSLNINNFYYKELIVCENNEPIKVKMYNNNSNNYEEKTLNKGDKFYYRSVFHNEHIIPIKVVIQELKNLNVVDYENVDTVLKKIKICRMLKEEDRKILHKHARPFDVEEVIRNMYNPVGIEID